MLNETPNGNLEIHRSEMTEAQFFGCEIQLRQSHNENFASVTSDLWVSTLQL